MFKPNIDLGPKTPPLPLTTGIPRLSPLTAPGHRDVDRKQAWTVGGDEGRRCRMGAVHGRSLTESCEELGLVRGQEQDLGGELPGAIA